MAGPKITVAFPFSSEFPGSRPTVRFVEAHGCQAIVVDKINSGKKKASEIRSGICIRRD